MRVSFKWKKIINCRTFCDKINNINNAFRIELQKALLFRNKDFGIGSVWRIYFYLRPLVASVRRDVWALSKDSDHFSRAESRLSRLRRWCWDKYLSSSVRLFLEEIWNVGADDGREQANCNLKNKFRNIKLRNSCLKEKNILASE